MPASLLANWRAEIERFTPALSFVIVHPSEAEEPQALLESPAGQRADLVITTYGMLARMEGLRQRAWNVVILDEAQAIKNAGTRQARAVKELKAKARFALTGTPVENRAGDLWSIFDFLNPGPARLGERVLQVHPRSRGLGPAGLWPAARPHAALHPAAA